MRTLFILCVLAIITPYYFISAQVSSDIVGDSIKINLDQQYPNPGQGVTATLDDYAINNTGASIAWFADGKNIVNTNDSRSITFTAPGVGQSMEITVKLISSSGQTLTAKQVIKPVYLDLIIEPQTYTPVFYEGRALPVNGSIINLNALLGNETGLVDTSKYTYNWVLNNNSVYGGPRKGNSWAQISIPYSKEALVSVTVQDRSGVTIARKTVRIPIKNVGLEFYEVNTLYGLSNKAVGNTLTLIGNSTSIRAVPYNLDKRVAGSGLFSQWSINSQVVNNPNNDPFLINLTRSTGQKATVGFKLRNLDELVQGDEKSFSVQF